MYATRAAMTVFVDRQAEWEKLQAWLAALWAGDGGIIMVTGEAGIGKTRIAREFASAVGQHGGTVLWGHCYEDEWALPYGPWREAIGDYVRSHDANHLSTALGASLPILATFVLEVQDRFPDLPAPAPLNSDSERIRLHETIARLFLAAAAENPLLLILDDLHWADRASLAILRHLDYAVRRAPLLIVGTYREHDVGPDHPLNELLGVLPRATRYLHLPLNGLGEDDVATLVAGHSAQWVSPDLVARIHSETNGNPFFVEEVIQHLEEEGRRRMLESVLGSGDLGVPEGVRQVVRHRLSRLTPTTNRMLTQAAAFSAGFEFPVVQALTELPEAELLASIDEALATRFIQPKINGHERYDFVHAIVRQTLYDGLSPSRRVRLHREAALALERAYGDRAISQAAADLAAHYYASAGLPGAAAGIPFALAAAEQARAGYDREREVAFLRIARQLAELELPAAESSDNVLMRLAVAEAQAGMLAAAVETTDTALISLEQHQAAPGQIAGFLVNVARPLKEGGADSAIWRRLVRRGLDLLADQHDLTWARLMLLRDPIAPVSEGRIHAGHWHGFAPEAVDLARASAIEDDYARTIESYDPRTPAETAGLIAMVRDWQQPIAVLRGLTVAANDLHNRHGDFTGAEALWHDVLGLSEHVGGLFWQAQALYQLTFLAIARGDFAEAHEIQTRANEMLARLGPYRVPEAIATEMAAAFADDLDGDWREIASFFSHAIADPAALRGDASTLGTLYAGWAALALTRSGQVEAARQLLAELTPLLERVDQTMSNQNGAVALAATAVWELELTELAPAYRRLAANLVTVGFGDYPQTSIALTQARMAALMGDEAGAATHFDQARAEVIASGQRPLVAMIDYDQASVLLSGSRIDAERVMQLIDAAAAGFQALGMTAWGERTRQLGDRLATSGGGRTIYPAGLTEREVDVLRLVVRGQSAQQISDELFISPRTVNSHMQNMFGKTGTANRVQLSMWAIERGIVPAGGGGGAESW